MGLARDEGNARDRGALGLSVLAAGAGEMWLKKGKSSAILGVLRLEGQPPHVSQDSDDLSSRARVTVPGFRTARSVASRR